MRISRAGILTLIGIGVVVAAAALYTIFLTNGRDAADSDAARTLNAEDEDVIFTNVSGESFDFEKYEGRVRVVNVWASWTPFSKQELADLATLSTEYPVQEVAVIAINRKEPKERAAAFIETLEETGNIIFVQDENDSFYRSVDGYAMPETVVFDEKGNVVIHKRGHMSLSGMREHTEAALQASE